MEDHPGTAPGSLDLKDRRVAILPVIRGLGRFQICFLAQHDRAGVAEVVDPAAPEAHGREPELAVNAHGVLL